MIVRVQSAEGTSRVEVSADEVTAQLYERVHAALGLSSFAFALHRDRQRRDEIASSKSRRLRDCGLQHGDMLYLSPVNGALLFEHEPPDDVGNNGVTEEKTVASTSRCDTGSSVAAASVPDGTELQEDEVDIQLYSEPGTIHRQRDEKLCRHAANGCCVHCAPLEPWDAGYLQAHNIKHMSFHAYLRKLQASNPYLCLNELSYEIKPGCRDHPPWPRGICSACQPGPVTLARQPYRHVDNVVMEHAAVVERFLAAWRATGHQRAGVLYGRWERHPPVPLGVRARVAAVYEPPQRGARDRLALLPDPRRAALDRLAARLGLRAVGWMFTDLEALDAGAGTVRHLRGPHAHLLSAQEVLMAAHYQHEHPSACRHAAAGRFGSKWVTVCASGDAAHRVGLEGYQVSAQAQALVRAGLLLPTKDAPELAYVREPAPARYAPDVYYTRRDRYGNEETVRATRLPVEYLLVDVPVGAAAAAEPTFSAAAAFPPAHRAHQPQSAGALRAALARAPPLEALSDLHALLFVSTECALPPPDVEALLAAVAARDAAAAAAWCTRPAVAALLAPPPPPPPRHWTCPLCTFHNATDRDSCEMCAVPRHAAE